MQGSWSPFSDLTLNKRRDCTKRRVPGAEVEFQNHNRLTFFEQDQGPASRSDRLGSIRQPCRSPPARRARTLSVGPRARETAPALRFSDRRQAACCPLPLKLWNSSGI